MGNWQDSHRLTNLTHLDGRNAAKLTHLRPYFSEYAWMKERLYVLVSHLITLAPFVTKPLRNSDVRNLQKIATNFSISQAEEVVRIEKTVNHDLKALEVFFNRKLPKDLMHLARFTLYGLGSEDINSIAFARLITRSRGDVLIPELLRLAYTVVRMSKNEANTVMIARTHGLPAGLTTFGKELANPLLRLCDEITTCASFTFQAKVTGEVGSLYSLSQAGYRIDWLKFGDRFAHQMGVESAHGSTQIVPYDRLIQYLQSMFRANTILIDLCKNMWLYILLGYIRVVKKDQEVGSSGMPHKVNPIYFEGAEGGLVMANGIIETMARTLMINRLQRDFSDSTIRRNISLVYGYSVLSYQSITEAFARLMVNADAIASDITRHGEVWVEPLKIIMIGAGREDAYEILRQKTRGNSFTADELFALIKELHLGETVQKNMYSLMHGKFKNSYPARVVREAESKVRQLKKL